MTDQIHKIFLNSKGVHTDTRTIQKDHLFFALSGENFDGNKYVATALEKGALHVISNATEWESHEKVTVVRDVLVTLQELATYHRKHLDLPIVALTGSNGKTTTKELILSVLSTRFNVKGTKGNLNNHIGVPLTILSFDSSTQIGVVEMGANHPKEIAALAAITQPNYGLITNYGKAHLEGFGSIEGVKTSKSELYDYLRNNNGTAIIGRWDPEQIVRSAGMQQIFTPIETSIHKKEPYLSFIVNGSLVKTQLTGVYNYHNALFAYSIGEIMEIEHEKIIEGIENYIPQSNRSQIINKNKATIILDAYNANPSSMKVALENIATQKTPFKTVVLGDMFELGSYTDVEHEAIASFALSLGIDSIVLVGNHFFKTSVPETIKFKSTEDLISNHHLDTEKEQVILIKGSRGMALERILDSI